MLICWAGILIQPTHKIKKFLLSGSSPRKCWSVQVLCQEWIWRNQCKSFSQHWSGSCYQVSSFSWQSFSHFLTLSLSPFILSCSNLQKVKVCWLNQCTPCFFLMFIFLTFSHSLSLLSYSNWRKYVNEIKANLSLNIEVASVIKRVLSHANLSHNFSHSLSLLSYSKWRKYVDEIKVNLSLNIELAPVIKWVLSHADVSHNF